MAQSRRNKSLVVALYVNAALLFGRCRGTPSSTGGCVPGGLTANAHGGGMSAAAAKATAAVTIAQANSSVPNLFFIYSP